MDTPDFNLAKQKVMTAVSLLQTGMESDVILRPSACGSCPRRLWYQQQAQRTGAVSAAREPRFSWFALQGTVTEAVLRDIIEEAGAEVLHPPDRDLSTPAIQFTDTETGMQPHVDGAIRWPEVGINEWAFLEFKNLRTMAAVDLVLEGLQPDRMYWFQAVAYLMLGRIAIDNMGWDIPTPNQMVFWMAAKDPSTTNMMVRQRVKPTKKETDHPEKMKDEEITRARLKAGWRERLVNLGSDYGSFYVELIHKDDPDVQATWEEIKALVPMLAADTPPHPEVHNPLLPENELNVECAAYCDYTVECIADAMAHTIKS